MADYVFNDTTYVQDGLIQECEDICNLSAGGISGNTARLRTFTRRLNQAKDKFFVIARKYDQLWKWDDRRYADGDLTLPIASTSLVSGTGDYLFDDDLLTVEQVFACDSSGVFHELTPQDDRNEPASYLTRESGTPTKYELVGNSIVLDKKPNYNSSKDDGKGLKVVFGRKAVNFVSTNGAVPISVPQIFFEYLANKASVPYLREKSLKHYNAVKQDVFAMETVDIPQFISNRAKPKRAGIKVRVESNK